MLIGPPIPEIQLFKKLTLKIQVQGHGWGQSSKTQCESNIYCLTSRFYMSIWHPIAELQLFLKFDLEIQGSMSWKRSQFKVTMCGNIPIDSHPFCPMSIGLSILVIQHFQNLTLKLKGQGHGWGHSSKSQCASIDSHLFCSMSIGPPIPQIQHFQNKFDLENQGSRSNDLDVAQLQV